MANYNQIHLLGNVGTVEVKTFANGGKVVEASLATTKRWKDRSGDQHEETQWHRLVINGPQADIAEKYLEKGAPLFAVGEMTYRKYTGRDGAERTQAEVRVTSFQLLSKSGTPAPAAAPEVDDIEDNGDLPF
jgi:single-strand DNA-binding protein